MSSQIVRAFVYLAEDPQMETRLELRAEGSLTLNPAVNGIW